MQPKASGDLPSALAFLSRAESRLNLRQKILIALAGLGSELFLGDTKTLKAVDAKAAKIDPEFAPGHQSPDIPPEEQRQGAQLALGDLSFFITVRDFNHLAALD